VAGESSSSSPALCHRIRATRPQMADAIQRITSDLGVPYIFKAVTTRQPTSSIASAVRAYGRHPHPRGYSRGAWSPCPHRRPYAEDCARVAEAVDVLQIPAFLCRQTDLLIAAAEAAKRHGGQSTSRKGSLSSRRHGHAVQKVRESGCDHVSLTERGASFGYNNLVVDMRSLPSCASSLPSSSTEPIQSNAFGGNGVSGGQPNSSLCSPAPLWPPE